MAKIARNLVAVAAIASVAGLGYYLASSSWATTVNPLAGHKLYVANHPRALQTAEEWKFSRPADAADMRFLASVPHSMWLGGWLSDVKAFTNNIVTAASTSGTLPVLVTYNIPNRDCGSYSAGGLASHSAYRTWIDSIAAGIGPRKAVVIIEPDAIPGVHCLDEAGKTARYESIKYAVQKIKSTTGAFVYIDAGHNNWVPAGELALRLQASGIASSDGFSLNVSNYERTADVELFGANLSSRVGGKHFVVDTSRNGVGPTSTNEWCNPSGRAVGDIPTTYTQKSLVDAYLWVKTPGESDGTCNGGPSAGSWWPEYGLGLVQRSAYANETTYNPPQPPTGSPDVVVTSLSMTPSAPKAGDQVVFTAVVKNQGTAATPSDQAVGVSFSINGVKQTWGSRTALAAGESATLTAIGSNLNPGTNYWTAVDGTHTLEAFVDDLNRFAESNETNNKKSLSFTVGTATTALPDVVILSLSMVPSAPKAGDQVVFTAVIKNQGAAVTPSGQAVGVAFSVNGTKVTWASRAAMAAGETATLTAQGSDVQPGTNYWTAVSGTHTLTGFVDDLNRFAESNETNNKLSQQFTVATAVSGIPGDVNRDGKVNAIDLSVMLSKDGQNYAPADFNGDGVVGAADMAILLSKWTW